MVAQAIGGLIAVIIGVVIITALALTVTENTDTSTGATLENVSQDAKSLYGLYDLVWAAGGLILIVAGLFTIATSFGKKR